MTSRPNLRWAMIVLAVGLSSVPSRSQTVDSVLQKTRDYYVSLKSYSDNGTVLDEYGANAHAKHTFTTLFNRSPRHFLLDFTKEGGDQFVIWSDPDAFHTWWKTTGQQTDYPNPNNIPAISLSGFNTKNVAMKIPTLLYGKSPLAAALLAIHDPELDGTETIAGQSCYRLVGRASDVYTATQKEVNVHRITVWIDTRSFLVRQVKEEWKTTPGNINRVTTTYQPQANPTLDDSKFKFSPPEAK